MNIITMDVIHKDGYIPLTSIKIGNIHKINDDTINDSK